MDSNMASFMTTPKEKRQGVLKSGEHGGHEMEQQD
jgi:hypothetical protein